LFAFCCFGRKESEDCGGFSSRLGYLFFGVWGFGGIFLLVFEPLRRLSRSPSVERLPKQSQLKETKAKVKAEA